jgi:hypothetical protein
MGLFDSLWEALAPKSKEPTQEQRQAMQDYADFAGVDNFSQVFGKREGQPYGGELPSQEEIDRAKNKRP